jgi:exonuclease III
MFWYSLLFVTLFSLNANADTQCPTVSNPGDRRSENKSQFRLMQYNVEWLFTDYYSNAACPGTGCPWKNISEAETHMNYVTNVIATLNPDFVNLCEVEGCDELNELSNNLNKNTVSYKPYLIKGTDSATGQNVGIITKIDPTVNLYRDESRVSYPIPGSKCGYSGASGTEGISKHYITEMKLGNYNVALIGLHLLAYPTDVTRCVERESQSIVAQNIIKSYLDKNYEVIVMGDLNDYDGSVPDLNDSQPTSQVLEILKVNGQLKPVSTLIEKNERYTDWWDRDFSCDSSNYEFNMIDHILVTPNLYNHIISAFIYHGYEEFCGKYNSDHFPVLIDFEF